MAPSASSKVFFDTQYTRFKDLDRPHHAAGARRTHFATLLRFTMTPTQPGPALKTATGFRRKIQ